MKVFCILATVLALTALTQAQAEADAEDTVGTKSFGVIQKAPSNRVSCNCQCDNYTYKGDDNRIHGNCFTYQVTQKSMTTILRQFADNQCKSVNMCAKIGVRLNFLACFGVLCSISCSVWGQGLSQYGSAQPPQSQYNSGSGGGGSAGFNSGSSSQQGMPYSFNYQVNAPEYANDYGHQEQSDGNVVRGTYRVALPDGRIQIVTYTADHDTGYQAQWYNEVLLTVDLTMASIQQLGNVLAQAPLNLSENEEIYEIDYDNVSPDMPKWVFHAACVALASLGTFGIVANFIVFTLFVITPMIRTPFNYILMNMIFSDSCIAFYGVPVDFMASYGYGWKLGKKLCLTTGFILTTVGTVSICTLATLSVQRYMTLLCPERFKISSYSTSGFMVVSIWLYTFTVSVPPFFGWGEFVPETSGLTYVTPAVVVIPLMTAKSSVCWNPIIYVAMNPQFRGAFRRFIKSHRTRKMERRWDRIQRSGKATTKPVKKIQLPFVSAKDRLSLSSSYWRGCVSLQSGGCYRPDGIANLAQNQSPRQLLQVVASLAIEVATVDAAFLVFAVLSTADLFQLAAWAANVSAFLHKGGMTMPADLDRVVVCPALASEGRGEDNLAQRIPLAILPVRAPNRLPSFHDRGPDSQLIERVQPCQVEEVSNLNMILPALPSDGPGLFV
eukprot:snap_masked-scaffold442_size170051-processed-gene-0.6 protein:Tk02849 transcript:snap_masked-scaffold442_size170051-processed-gene-0.6-mRNA-1 annotation:"hypothetical protein TcasGA2_TC007259"